MGIINFAEKKAMKAIKKILDKDIALEQKYATNNPIYNLGGKPWELTEVYGPRTVDGRRYENIVQFLRERKEPGKFSNDPQTAFMELVTQEIAPNSDYLKKTGNIDTITHNWIGNQWHNSIGPSSRRYLKNDLANVFFADGSQI